MWSTEHRCRGDRRPGRAIWLPAAPVTVAGQRRNRTDFPHAWRPLPYLAVRPRLHAVTWLVWALAAAASVELAPSPLYVAIVIAVAALVVQVHAEQTALARAFPALLLVGVAFGALRVVLTAATTHGVGTVLFTAPAVTLPRLLGGFTVGGTVELPVVLQAAAEAFAIVGILAAFGAFNAVVSHHELLQSAPRAFYEPGLVVTVALAFVPSTMSAIGAAREADLARTGGRVVRRGRLLRLAVPILESGMERALALAESMDARGFGATTPARAERTAGWCGLGGLIGLGGAFVALIGNARAVAVTLAVGGAAAVAVAIVVASRASGRYRYRARRLNRTDWSVVALCLLAPVVIGLLGASGHTLSWSATPLELPNFDVLAGAALCALSAPALAS